MYYKLDEFYGNHKNYIDSKSFKQLRGNTISGTGDCSPVETNEDIADTLTSVTGTTLNDDDTAYPCGLGPKYVFNDTFGLTDSSGTTFTLDDSNIALYIEKESRFGNTDSLERQWLDMADQHFMVWMRVELFPVFDKMYAKVDGTLKAGEPYTVSITNNYVHDGFSIKKSVVFSTTNGLGEDLVLGWFFMVASWIVLLVLVPGMIVLEILKAKDMLPWLKQNE